MITLYDYELSAECYKVRLMLSCLSLPHHVIAVDIHPGRDHRADWFLDLSPLGEVPVLADGTQVLTDPQAILIWLARRAGSAAHWLPDDPPSLAGVARWHGIAARLAATAGAARMAMATTEDADLPALHAGAHRLLRMIDEHLWFAEREGHPWLLQGPDPMVADIACFPDIALCEEGGVSRQDYPAIRRWLDRVRRIDGFTVMSGIFPASRPAAP